MYLLSCIYLFVIVYTKKSYACTVPSPNLLSSLLLKSSIFLALITSSSSLFQASIWEAIFLYVPLYKFQFKISYSTYVFHNTLKPWFTKITKNLHSTLCILSLHHTQPPLHTSNPSTCISKASQIYIHIISYT